MDKRILKKIAQDWCKSILHSNDSTSFGSELSEEEIDYIVKESKKIANKITNRPLAFSTEEIVKRYYEFEE